MPTETVTTIVDAYRVWSAGYYRDGHGRPTGHAQNIEYAVRTLLTLFASRPLASLTARDYRSLQSAIVGSGVCRNSVNARMKLVRHLVKWAVSWDYVHPDALGRCASVPPLRRGRTEARESPGVAPVEWDRVAAVLPTVVPAVRAAVLVHWWTGMRVGELLSMRGDDVVEVGGELVYRPRHHKTAYHGHARFIVLGPSARATLPPLVPGHLFVTATGRPYTPGGYRLSIVRACGRAGVRPWTPLQLRHSAATRFRAELGIEATRVLLGHRSAVMSEIYAERDLASACRDARRVA